MYQAAADHEVPTFKKMLTPVNDLVLSQEDTPQTNRMVREMLIISLGCYEITTVSLVAALAALNRWMKVR